MLVCFCLRIRHSVNFLAHLTYLKMRRLIAVHDLHALCLHADLGKDALFSLVEIINGALHFFRHR